MVERFERGRATPADTPLPSGARRGVLTSLATSFPAAGGLLPDWRAAHPEAREHDGRDLALVPTVFDEIDERLCRALVRRGWWLTGAALSLYHTGRIGDPARLEPPAA
jgi:NTE family protein